MTGRFTGLAQTRRSPWETALKPSSKQLKGNRVLTIRSPSDSREVSFTRLTSDFGEHGKGLQSPVHRSDSRSQLPPAGAPVGRVERSAEVHQPWEASEALQPGRRSAWSPTRPATRSKAYAPNCVPVLAGHVLVTNDDGRPRTAADGGAPCVPVTSENAEEGGLDGTGSDGRM